MFWSDIGGNKAIINTIRQNIEWPLKHPEAFNRLGVKPPNGILLYGPPGCSKTLIAKALATESNLSFLAVKGPELFSKYVGDTEKAIRNVFRKARLSAPSIIFFDEIDSMAEQRGSDTSNSDKVLCQLLNEMDGIESRKQVVIVGATNRPDILDKALIRPGRFDKLLYIPPPDFEARREIFKIGIKCMKVDDEVKNSVDKLAEMTERFSGAEISMCCMEAGVLQLAVDIESQEVKLEMFIKAISSVKRNITLEMIEFYEGFNDKSGKQNLKGAKELEISIDKNKRKKSRSVNSEL